MTTRLVHVLLWTAVLPAPTSAAEDLKQVVSEVRVEYVDGSSEKYVVRWAGAVLSDRRETGGPATPLQGKWTDDRQCHWVVRTVVSRRVFLKSRSGEEFERPESRKLFESSKEKSGAGFRIEHLRPENCNDAEAKIARDLEEARTRAVTALEEVVEEDRDELRARMTAWEGVRKVKFARVSGGSSSGGRE